MSRNQPSDNLTRLQTPHALLPADDRWHTIDTRWIASAMARIERTRGGYGLRLLRTPEGVALHEPRLVGMCVIALHKDGEVMVSVACSFKTVGDALRAWRMYVSGSIPDMMLADMTPDDVIWIGDAARGK